MAIAIGALIYALSSMPDQNIPTIIIYPEVATSATIRDADDPAIWLNPADPSKSMVIGTDKGGANHGGLFVWDMNGSEMQHVYLNHPNNVDARQGMQLGEESVDIVVVNLRKSRELKVFKVNPENGTLEDITTDDGIYTAEVDDPYGLCLYRRPTDGAMFVIESSEGGKNENLYQYRLQDDGTGKVEAVFVRTFGDKSIQYYVEGLVADDDLGYVYASDETKAIRKYYANPDQGNDDQIVAFAKGDGIVGDREGLAIYKHPNGTGYLLLSSQHDSTIKIYRREGDGGDPRKHSLVATIKPVGASEADGLDVTSQPILPQYPDGFLVVHNAPGRQFKIYSWEKVNAYLRKHSDNRR